MKTLAAILLLTAPPGIAQACTATVLSDVGDTSGHAMMTGEIVTGFTVLSHDKDGTVRACLKTGDDDDQCYLVVVDDHKMLELIGCKVAEFSHKMGGRDVYDIDDTKTDADRKFFGTAKELFEAKYKIDQLEGNSNAEKEKASSCNIEAVFAAESWLVPFVKSQRAKGAVIMDDDWHIVGRLASGAPSQYNQLFDTAGHLRGGLDQGKVTLFRDGASTPIGTYRQTKAGIVVTMSGKAPVTLRARLP